MRRCVPYVQPPVRDDSVGTNVRAWCPPPVTRREIRSIILDQIHRNPRGQGLPDAILCPLAGLEGSMQRDAQVRTSLNLLPVARRPRDVAQALPVGKMRLDGDPSSLPATLNEWSTPGAPPWTTTRSGPMPREHTVQHLLGEVITSPMAVACN